MCPGFPWFFARSEGGRRSGAHRAAQMMCILVFVATDLPEVDPDETSWCIDKSHALDQLKCVEEHLMVSSGTDP